MGLSEGKVNEALGSDDLCRDDGFLSFSAGNPIEILSKSRLLQQNLGFRAV